LPHHDDVDSAGVRGQIIFSRDAQHLPHDLSRAEAAFEAHQCCQAKFAIDRAADLAGDAYRRALSFWHPDCFDCFAVGKSKQVAASAVHGIVTLLHLRHAQGKFLRQAGA